MLNTSRGKCVDPGCAEPALIGVHCLRHHRVADLIEFGTYEDFETEEEVRAFIAEVDFASGNARDGRHPIRRPSSFSGEGV